MQHPAIPSSRTELTAPHRGEFIQLLRAGAAGRDIHDPDPARATGAWRGVTRAFVERELGRVMLHSRCLLPLRQQHLFRKAGT